MEEVTMWIGAWATVLGLLYIGLRINEWLRERSEENEHARMVMESLMRDGWEDR